MPMLSILCLLLALPAQSAHLREEIEERHSDPLYRDLQALYRATADAPLWLRGTEPTQEAQALLQVLQDAPRKGLRAEDYAVIALRGEEDLARFDVALSWAAMRYVSDLTTGRLNPQRLYVGIAVPGEPLDLPVFVRDRLARTTDPGALLETIETPFPSYRRVLAALQHYLELAPQDDGEPLPDPGRTIAPGPAYAGAARLSRLLRLVGDLPASASDPDALVDAMKHFQRRHGLPPDGRIDRATFRALNTPLSRRVQQLQLALERLRWLPHRFPRPPLVINVPEFRLHGDDARYRWVLSMKVIVGRAYRHQTPLFASQIESVIFRPPWNVPLDIQRDELVPELTAHPELIGEMGYEVVDRSTQSVEDGNLDADTVERLRSGNLVLRQKPGPRNALGLVKFVFPNRYGVYLHGTPTFRLFARDRRDFSHGCIRAEDPAALAAWVLQDHPEWTPERIQAAMTGDETIRVKLEQPVPILILYSTAVVTEDGELHFFEDVYGHDRLLERALAKVEQDRG